MFVGKISTILYIRNRKIAIVNFLDEHSILILDTDFRNQELRMILVENKEM